MNKRIIISLSVIGLVAAIAIGGTIAYFSDTETSTGNLFAAGSIDLKIDNHCYYNDDECAFEGEGYLWQTGPNDGEPCFCTWELKDLDGELFFNFEDLKPGDWGEDTVSLHVYDNDAWACVTFENMVDYDNTCTEPEGKDENDPIAGQCAEPGELSQYLYFFFWADMCSDPGWNVYPGDNIYQPECEEPLMDGWADDILPGTTYTLAAPGEYNVFTGVLDEPLTGSHDYFIGKVWCFGELDWIPDPMGAIFTCNGQPVDNIPQTDSLEADIIFYAEQSRNNPNFTCLQPIRYTSSPQNYSGTGWAGWSCPPEHPTAVGGGVIGNTYPMGAQGIAVPGATIGGFTYPTFPHYVYETWYAGETGYVAQNGGTAQTCQIYVDCL